MTFARLKQRIEAAIAAISATRGERFGAFEALFALACLHFQESECEFIVFEAGIGGRYDPVRLVGARETCVTSVDYEHVELLGNSLELIVSDKSDACAAGGTIIYGENCRGLRPHLLEYNRYRGVTSLFVRDEIGIDGESASASGQRFDFRFGDHRLSRRSRRTCSARCSSTTPRSPSPCSCSGCNACSRARRRSGSRPRYEPACATRSWPGRLEIIAQDPLTVIDVGHTPDGIRQSLASLKAIHGAEDWILVTGASGDKKADEIVGSLAPSFDTIICTAAYHKGAAPQDIAAAARRANPAAEIHVAADDRGRRAPGARAGRVAQAKTICGGRAVPGDRIRNGRPRRPRAGFEVFLEQVSPPSLRGAQATKQSILSLLGEMDCFASLAMTVAPSCSLPAYRRAP